LRGPVESHFGATEAAASAARGKRVFLLAGIARPASFEATVRGLGASVVGARFFGDHHPFSRDELARVSRAALLASAELVVTTEKDQTRILDWPAPLPLLAVPGSLQLSSGAEALEAALAAVLASVLAAVLG